MAKKLRCDEYVGNGTNMVTIDGDDFPFLLSGEECDNLRIHSDLGTRLTFTNIITRRTIKANGVGIPVRN